MYLYCFVMRCWMLGMIVGSYRTRARATKVPLRAPPMHCNCARPNGREEGREGAERGRMEQEEGGYDLQEIIYWESWTFGREVGGCCVSVSEGG